MLGFTAFILLGNLHPLVALAQGDSLTPHLPVANQASAVSHDGSVTKSFTEPIETSTVAAIELGVIEQSKIQEGDRVTAGQHLATLNSAVLIESRRLAVAKAESTAARDAARSKLALVNSQLQNLRSLAPGGHVNKYELEQKTSEFQNATSELKRVEEELMLSRIEVDRIDAQIKQRKINSPITGFVVKIHKRLGEQVSTNKPDYATIVRIDQLKIKFFLNLSTLKMIKAGSTVEVHVDNEASSRLAKVTFVSPIIDPDSGTGRIEVSIDNHDLKLRSGTVCHWISSKPRIRQAGSNRVPTPAIRPDYQR
jgi:RND family efflux transporter MFP subunit